MVVATSDGCMVRINKEDSVKCPVDVENGVILKDYVHILSRVPFQKGDNEAMVRGSIIDEAHVVDRVGHDNVLLDSIFWEASKRRIGSCQLFGIKHECIGANVRVRYREVLRPCHIYSTILK